MLETGEEYLVIYDDKGYKPVKKQGIVIEKNDILFVMRTERGEETLNFSNVIRAIKVERGNNGIKF